MLVLLKHRLVILATPKCASTAIESAFSAHADIVIRGHPGAKHTNFRKYDRHIRPFIETFGRERFETVCLFRDPIDWLNSWWRYRSRPGIPDRSKSTEGMPFARFVNAYLDGDGGRTSLGRQSRFVAGRDGGIGVDRIYRYDNLAAFMAYLSQRTGLDLPLAAENASPPGQAHDSLGAATSARAQAELARDFEIYRTVAR